MITESKSLANISHTDISQPFTSVESFQLAQRIANVFAQSDMVPQQYKSNVGNCIIALEIASRIGASPLMVMQNLHIIQGKPTWSSAFLIATLNACGKFSPIRYDEDEQEGGRCRAWAVDKATNEKLYGVWVSMDMADAEGWTKKGGSKWKSLPQLMRRYRAASFFTRQFAPEVSMGLQTFEEAIDISGNSITLNQSTTKLTEMPESGMDAIKRAIAGGADEYEIREAVDKMSSIMSDEQKETINQLLIQREQ